MTITKRYFINRDGISTSRMAAPAGAGHFEIAQAVEKLTPGTDFYEQMFALKYLRVAEDISTHTFYVDSPVPVVDKLTNGQRRWVKGMQADGWTLVYNSKEFVETRDQSLVKRLVE